MIYIWVRRTLDWGREDGGLIDPSMRRTVRLWDSTFNVPYIAFRARIAEIAELNHSRVQGAERAGWDEIPDGAIVLPVDDDDWFAPDAALVLERERRAATAFVWDARWIEVPLNPGHHLWLIRRRLIPVTPDIWICTTNNYALVKGPESLELLISHTSASRSFRARLDRADRGVKRLDGQLSVANRTLASITTLQLGRSAAAITRAQLIRKFRRYKRLYERPVPRELEWCQPYLKMMSELMDGLELKR